MSAIEFLPPVVASLGATDRRTTPRHRVQEPFIINVGRGDGVLIDISTSGARVRHSTPVRLGSQVRFSFEWEKQRFGNTSVVLSSRVIALGGTPGSATLFESRLRFVAISSDSADLLTEFIDALGSSDLRRWVANLRGWPYEERRPNAKVSFIRCRRRNGGWEKKWTRDSSQPEDGFTVPASIDESELALLCRMWDASDDDSREILRQSAHASVDCSLL
jgi:hypothetical protein